MAKSFERRLEPLPDKSPKRIGNIGSVPSVDEDACEMRPARNAAASLFHFRQRDLNALLPQALRKITVAFAPLFLLQRDPFEERPGGLAGGEIGKQV